MKIAKTLLVGLITVTGFYASAQTADDIAAKHIVALGGKEKLATLKSVRMTGNMSANGADISLVLSKLNQVGMRMDLDIMGSANYQILNGKTGWVFFPVMGMTEPKEMEAPAYKSNLNQLDIQDALYNYKEKGNTIALLGNEKVDGVDANKIKVTFKNGYTSTYFIDVKTDRTVKTVTTSMANGSPMEVETSFSDYKQNADGYWFPYTVTNAQGTINFDKIETNVALDAKIFSN